jgi:hypothetical protein
VLVQFLGSEVDGTVMPKMKKRNQQELQLLAVPELYYVLLALLATATTRQQAAQQAQANTSEQQQQEQPNECRHSVKLLHELGMPHLVQLKPKILERWSTGVFEILLQIMICAQARYNLAQQQSSSSSSSADASADNLRLKSLEVPLLLVIVEALMLLRDNPHWPKKIAMLMGLLENLVRPSHQACGSQAAAALLQPLLVQLGPAVLQASTATAAAAGGSSNDVKPVQPGLLGWYRGCLCMVSCVLPVFMAPGHVPTSHVVRRCLRTDEICCVSSHTGTGSSAS